ncbi:hypothetical protein [Saccharothrix violaceirubra]|uniref:Uncharacterized protein n=1 Tax=Saccharothrix violaceirubra TaxID=413306 RepID=A0A7W7T314_9PSEU|nr:hypothetical protein [Saccharothrix violaceirubra]MBB4965634.1 hypothetical protein [Saccharothrix violaceirubra]
MFHTPVDGRHLPKIDGDPAIITSKGGGIGSETVPPPTMRT